MTRRSAVDQMAASLAEATGRSKEEIKILGAVAGIAIAGAVVFRTIEWLVDMGFDRSSRSHR